MKVFLINCEKAQKDTEAAELIGRILQERGVFIFHPTKSLSPGQHRKSVPQKAMREADYAIFIVSRDFLTSRGSHQALLKKAFRRQEEFPSGSRFIIPVMIDNCKEKYDAHPDFSKLQFIDLTKYGAHQKKAAFQKALPEFITEL